MPIYINRTNAGKNQMMNNMMNKMMMNNMFEICHVA